MPVSSTIKTKVEVQKLIKEYKKLQQEAKTADIEEAERKAAEAEKLMSQINRLQTAISSSGSKEGTHPHGAIKKEVTPRSAEQLDKRIELEKRINRIEEAQKRTRVQIEQLNKAKAELSNLQTKAEAARIAFTEHRPKAQELEKYKKLVQMKDEQYVKLKKDSDTFRHQVQKDAELLRNERDAALDKQKQLEKENLRLLRQRGHSGFLKGVLIGGGVGVLCLIVLAVVSFQTALLDPFICELKAYPDKCSFSVVPTSLMNDNEEKTKNSLLNQDTSVHE
jgi:DNA repair exonuclease SbcCD ATPase subunit